MPPRPNTTSLSATMKGGRDVHDYRPGKHAGPPSRRPATASGVGLGVGADCRRCDGELGGCEYGQWCRQRVTAPPCAWCLPGSCRAGTWATFIGSTPGERSNTAFVPRLTRRSCHPTPPASSISRPRRTSEVPRRSSTSTDRGTKSFQIPDPTLNLPGGVWFGNSTIAMEGWGLDFDPRGRALRSSLLRWRRTDQADRRRSEP